MVQKCPAPSHGPWHLQALRPYVAHVRVADAVQVVVSSAQRVAEDSALDLGEYVAVLVPSYRAHVCAERQCAPRRRFPDALGPGMSLTRETHQEFWTSELQACSVDQAS